MSQLTIADLALTAEAEAEGQDSALPKAFVFSWFQLFRIAQMHALGNDAVRRPVERFVEATNAIVGRDGAASFQAKDGMLFVNSVKLPLTSAEYTDTAETIFGYFETLGIGGFVIAGVLDVDTVHQLLNIMVYAPPKARVHSIIAKELAAAELPLRVNKSLGVGNGDNDGNAVLERRSYTFLTYSKLVVLYRSIISEEIGASRRMYVMKKIGRTIESLVDICLEDDHTFLGIASVKSAEAYLPHHAANVAVLAIVIGEKLGLDKVALADLGTAALFSDVGLRELPQAIVSKGIDPNREISDDERAQLERHPLDGVRFLLEARRYTKSVLRRILVAFEHHRHVDGGGYPSLARPPLLFSRIVAIADAYDELTTAHPERQAQLPDEALGRMLSESGTRFDPRLLKIFINTLGMYPLGTLVRLSTGEMAVVVFGGGEDPARMTRPIVAVLDREGKPGRTLDLTETDASGGYVRDIVTSEDPTKYGLQPSGLLAISPAS